MIETPDVLDALDEAADVAPVTEILLPGDAGRFDLDDDTQRVVVTDDGRRFVLTVTPENQ